MYRRQQEIMYRRQQERCSFTINRQVVLFSLVTLLLFQLHIKPALPPNMKNTKQEDDSMHQNLQRNHHHL